MTDDIIDQLSYYVANEMRMPAGLIVTVINHIEAQQAEIKRLHKTSDNLARCINHHIVYDHYPYETQSNTIFELRKALSQYNKVRNERS